MKLAKKIDELASGFFGLVSHPKSLPRPFWGTLNVRKEQSLPQEGHDVGRVVDARTMSAMVKPAPEVEELRADAVGCGMVLPLSGASRLWNASYCAFQENAGYTA